MPAIDWWSFGISTGASILGGIGNVIQGRRQMEAQRAEANYNIDQLGLQFDRLEESYNENQRQLEQSLSQTLSQNNQNIWSTERAQQNNLAVASVSNTENQALMYASLASLQRQNMATVDSTVQSVASSGFRNTGSGANVINEAGRRASESYNQNLRATQLSAYQNYMQAANDYFSSNIQIEGYRASSRNAQENYSLQREMLESQYAYDREVTSGEIGYWEGIRDNSNYGFWDGVADFFSGW